MNDIRMWVKEVMVAMIFPPKCNNPGQILWVDTCPSHLPRWKLGIFLLSRATFFLHMHFYTGQLCKRGESFWEFTASATKIVLHLYIALWWALWSECTNNCTALIALSCTEYLHYSIALWWTVVHLLGRVRDQRHEHHNGDWLFIKV